MNKKGNNNGIIILLLIAGGLAFYFMYYAPMQTSEYKDNQIKESFNAHVASLGTNFHIDLPTWSYAVDSYIRYTKELCLQRNGTVVYLNNNLFSIFDFPVMDGALGNYTGPDIGCKVNGQNIRGDVLIGYDKFSNLVNFGYDAGVCYNEVSNAVTNKDMSQCGNFISCNSSLRTSVSDLCKGRICNGYYYDADEDNDKCSNFADGKCANYDLRIKNATDCLAMVGHQIITSVATLNPIVTDALTGNQISSFTDYISVERPPFRTGVTTASAGSFFIIVVTSSGYHSGIASFTVPNKPTMDIPVQLKKVAHPTITIFNTDGLVLSNGGGAVNQQVMAGGSYNLKVRIDGQDKASTNDMRCILETTSAASTSNIVLQYGFGSKVSDKGLNYKPNWYSLAGTGSMIYSYDISSINNAISPEGTISITSASGKSLAGSDLIFSCYSKEIFIDPVSGYDIYDVEDSLGNLKSLSTLTFKVRFVA